MPSLVSLTAPQNTQATRTSTPASRTRRATQAANPQPTNAAPSSSTTQLAPRDRSSVNTTQRGRIPAIAPQDQILFLGLNPAATHEQQALSRSGAYLEVIKGSLELNKPEEISQFVSSLNLDKSRSAKLTHLLNQAKASGRDELAAIAQVWVRAERGGSIPGRVVLSGHSDGLTIWSESGTGSLSFGDIGRLADLFPAAAAQIEDLHISGCNTGYRSNMQVISQHFPNLKTFWGYTHTAPAGSNGAPQHLKLWEAATRGERSDLNRQPVVKQLGGVARADNLALWSQVRGYQAADAGQAMDPTEMNQIIERYRLGEAVSNNPQTGPLKQVYDALQSLRGESSVASYDQQIGQALRLRYHENMANNFAAAYSDILSAGFKDLGLSAPDFSKLERREAIVTINSFNEALDLYRKKLQLQTSDEVKNNNLGPIDPEQQQTQQAAQLERLEKIETLLHHYSRMSPDFFPPEWTDPLTADGLTQARAAFEQLQPLPDMPLFGIPGLSLPGLGGGFVNPSLMPRLGANQDINIPFYPELQIEAPNLYPRQGNQPNRSIQSIRLDPSLRLNYHLPQAVGAGVAGAVGSALPHSDN